MREMAAIEALKSEKGEKEVSLISISQKKRVWILKNGLPICVAGAAAINRHLGSLGSSKIARV